MPAGKPSYWGGNSKINPDRDEPFDITGEEGALGDSGILDEDSNPEKILLDRESRSEEEEDDDDDEIVSPGDEENDEEDDDDEGDEGEVDASEDILHPSQSGSSSRELAASRDRWLRTHDNKKKRPKGEVTIRKELV